MLNAKKVAQRYDSEGKKSFEIENGRKKYTKRKILVLKNEKMDGPFVIILFKTGSEIDSDNKYEYQGRIIIEEGEYTYIYRDSLMDGYVDAKFCDDNTLLVDVRNKDKREKYAVQINGEPTGFDSWDFEDNDDENLTNKKMIESMRKNVSEELSIPEENVYPVIQLDC